jgi:uncharacterized LabA/DUF88 family protein
MQERSVAILIDGGFFLKRLRHLLPSATTPELQVAAIMRLCKSHLAQLAGLPMSGKPDSQNLLRFAYRIFYYDALPYAGKAHHVVNNLAIDYGKTDVAIARRQLFEILRTKRKVALRLGRTKLDQDWSIDPTLTKPMLQLLLKRLQTKDTSPQLVEDEQLALGKLITRWHQITEKRDAVKLGLRQKGVDMRIGVDIASLALKKQASTIVLVSGDSDFVPAAKLARREGIDFILDPLWQSVEPDLHEHIDGMQSGLPKPGN